MTRLLYLDQAATGARHGGSKAKRDVGEILRGEGARMLRIGGGGAVARARQWARVAYVAALAPRARLIANFPIYNRGARVAVRVLAVRHRLVYLVHDLDQLREVAPTQDLSALTQADACIVSGRLIDADSNFEWPDHVAMPVWDYVCQIPPLDWLPVASILFAGTLDRAKSPWLYAADRTLPLALAGTGQDDAHLLHQDRYLGPFDGDAPRFSAAIGWGLVWDGDRTDDLAGPTGSYQRFNAPHKLSLYLALGLPIICHRDAAASRFVRAHGCGFTVSSLDEISSTISSLTEKDARQMRTAALQQRERVVHGDFLRTALSEILASP